MCARGIDELMINIPTIIIIIIKCLFCKPVTDVISKSVYLRMVILDYFGIPWFVFVFILSSLMRRKCSFCSEKNFENVLNLTMFVRTVVVLCG